MKGLEIKEINYSEIELNKDARIDTQFWTEKNHYNLNLKYDKIGNCLLKAQYGISISMNEDNKGYPIYRMNEIHNMLCDLEVSKYADLTTEELKTFELKDGDVLFNRTNSFEWVGRTGIYYKNKSDLKKYVFASYLVRFIPDKNIILPEYLSAFLNSKYGVLDIKKRARQSINQTNVNPEEVKEIKIPLLSKNLQKHIKDNFVLGYLNMTLAIEKYIHAENLLKETLGLNDFSPNSSNINIKSLKDSFTLTNRLDAEYYQPKFEDYNKLIRSYNLGYESIENVCTIKDKNFLPEESEHYNYIELSNIGNTGNITGSTFAIGKSLPSRARRLVEKNDVIISSIEGSLQSCALITDTYDKSMCSTGFYVINSLKINSETLLVLFKSEMMQNIMKQNCSGTILTAINKNEFKNISIPLIDKIVQMKIAGLIQESFKLKNVGEQLLAKTKKAVEIAIEENEENAINYIKVEI